MQKNFSKYKQKQNKKLPEIQLKKHIIKIKNGENERIKYMRK